MKKIWDSPVTGFIIGFIIGFLLGFLMGLGLGCKQNKKEKSGIPTPVEKHIIDTLYVRHDSLIYRTKVLDSIKHDTIEKVYKLDDTSTLDLFYKLVSE